MKFSGLGILVLAALLSFHEAFAYANEADDAGDYYMHQSNSEIIQLSRQITAGKRTDVDKALAIYYWVLQKIPYAMRYATSPNLPEWTQDAIGALHHGEAVCAGIATLTASLLTAAGIPTKIVIGDAQGSTGCDHEWLKAYFGGHWANLDPTFDQALGPENDGGNRFTYASYNPLQEHTTCSVSHTYRRK